MKKKYTRSVLVRLLASLAVMGLLALYLLNVISGKAFLPLVVLVFLCFWRFLPNRKE